MKSYTLHSKRVMDFFNLEKGRIFKANLNLVKFFMKRVQFFVWIGTTLLIQSGVVSGTQMTGISSMLARPMGM